MSYSFLEPIKVGPHTLHNRVLYSAMGKAMCKDGYVSERFIEYYRSVAQGGTALIIPEIMVIDPEWEYVSNGAPHICDKKYLPGLKEFVEVVHSEGGLVYFQLWHPGAATMDPPDAKINSFTIDDIHAKQDLYYKGAQIAKLAGADGVEVHSAHNYLPSQFISPLFNHRTDEYSAYPIDNAVRFVYEIVTRIKTELCDDSFGIIVKISGSDFVPGGIEIDRACEVAAKLEACGTDLITVNGGSVLAFRSGLAGDTHYAEGYKVGFAEAIKKVVNIPIAASGNLTHYDYCDSIIRDGKCDVIAMARGLHAEHEWVNKAIQGRETEQRNCICCLYCWQCNGCSVNPTSTYEYLYNKPLSRGDGTTVAVIGAGPSGLEAAVNLAERGFKVVVYEKSNAIGGMLNLAIMPSGKEKLSWQIDYYQRQIDRLGIELHLNTEVTEAELKTLNPYAIIDACGSIEFMPDIPGIENTIGVRKAFFTNYSDKNIVVLGGGLTGLEAARFFAEHGNHVTVLEMLVSPDLGDTHWSKTHLKVEEANAREYAAAAGVKLRFGQTVTGIIGGEVQTVSTANSEKGLYKADVVVAAFGIKPNTVVAGRLKGRFDKFIPCGDAAATGNLADAISGGYKCALEL